MLGISAPCCGACCGFFGISVVGGMIEKAIQGVIYGPLNLWSENSMKTFGVRDTSYKTACLVKMLFTATTVSLAAGLAFRALLIVLGYQPWSILAFTLIFGLSGAFDGARIHSQINERGTMAVKGIPFPEESSCLPEIDLLET